MPIKKIKRPSRTQLHKKAKVLFSKVVRLVGHCEKCGGTENLQCSHVKSVGAHPSLKYNLDNAICLCYKCHLHWWHKEPTEAGLWFERNFPVRLAFLEKAVLHEDKGGAAPTLEFIIKKLELMLND